MRDPKLLHLFKSFKMGVITYLLRKDTITFPVKEEELKDFFSFCKKERVYLVSVMTVGVEEMYFEDEPSKQEQVDFMDGIGLFLVKKEMPLKMFLNQQ